MSLIDDCWELVIDQLYDDTPSLLALCAVSRFTFSMAVKVLYRDCLFIKTRRHASKLRLEHLLYLCSGFDTMVKTTTLPKPTWPNPVKKPTTIDYSQLVRIPIVSDTCDFGEDWIGYFQCFAGSIVEISVHASNLVLIMKLVPNLKVLEKVLFLPRPNKTALEPQDLETAIEFVKWHRKLFPKQLKEVNVKFQREEWVAYLKLQEALGKVQTLTLTKPITEDEIFMEMICLKGLKVLRFHGELDSQLGPLLMKCRALEELQLKHVHPKSLKWAVKEKNLSRDSGLGRLSTTSSLVLSTSSSPSPWSSSSLLSRYQFVQIKIIKIEGTMELMKDAFDGFSHSLEQADFRVLPTVVQPGSILNSNNNNNNNSSSSATSAFSWSCEMPRLTRLTCAQMNLDLESLDRCPNLRRITVDCQPDRTTPTTTIPTPTHILLSPRTLTYLTLNGNPASLLDFVSLRDLVQLQALTIDSRTGYIGRGGDNIEDRLRTLSASQAAESSPFLVDMTGWYFPHLRSVTVTAFAAEQSHGQWLRIAPNLEELFLSFWQRRQRKANVNVETFWPLNCSKDTVDRTEACDDDQQDQPLPSTSSSIPSLPSPSSPPLSSSSQCYPKLKSLRIRNCTVGLKDHVLFEAFFGSVAPPVPLRPPDELIPPYDPYIYTVETAPTGASIATDAGANSPIEQPSSPAPLPTRGGLLPTIVVKPKTNNPSSSSTSTSTFISSSTFGNLEPARSAKRGTTQPSMVPNLQYLHLENFHFFPRLDRLLLHVLEQDQTREILMQGVDAKFTRNMMNHALALVVPECPLVKEMEDGKQVYLAVLNQESQFVLKSQWSDWSKHAKVEPRKHYGSQRQNQSNSSGGIGTSLRNFFGFGQ